MWSKSDGLENDDRLPFRNALVDLVRVDGHAAHSKGRPPCITRKLRDQARPQPPGTCVLDMKGKALRHISTSHVGMKNGRNVVGWVS